MRRLGAALLVTAAIVAAGLAPAAASSRSTDPAPGDGGFVWPSAGKVSYIAAGGVTISWDAGDVTADSWQVVRSNGNIDQDGGCATVDYTAEAPLDTADPTPSLTLPGQLVDHCYQYAVWAASADVSTDPPAFVSGPLRVLTTWTGHENLYKHGVFSTQVRMTWCVAASVQMMLNIITGQSDHSAANQDKYIVYARRNDDYFTPKAKGSDAQGWAAALTHFGGGDYAAVSNPRFKASMRAIARRLRETGKPVGIIVAHSNHAWVVTGFDATADPAIDQQAVILALYVMGPLWPRSTSSGGYDPRPDTRLTFTQMKRFHTRYYDSEGPNNPWEGTFVSILP